MPYQQNDKKKAGNLQLWHNHMFSCSSFNWFMCELVQCESSAESPHIGRLTLEAKRKFDIKEVTMLITVTNERLRIML